MLLLMILLMIVVVVVVVVVVFDADVVVVVVVFVADVVDFVIVASGNPHFDLSYPGFHSSISSGLKLFTIRPNPVRYWTSPWN